MNKSTISMAMAVLAFQAGSVYSATVTITGSRATEPTTLPGAYVQLTSGDGAFVSTQYYAGVFYGTVGAISTAFFCAELNDGINFGLATTYTSSTLAGAQIRDGSPLNGGDLLTDQQKCMIMGVYKSLIPTITTVDGFVDETTSYQNLLGTTTPADATKLTLGGSPPLSHERAAAAQLVIWEIIHEPVSSFYYGMAPIIGLAGVNGGNLVWSLGSKSAPLAEFPAVWATISSEFDSLASAAYTHAATTCGLVAVPEITSPVALIAGGLLFLRRREPRRSRLTKSGDSSNQEIALTA